jgi:secreted trypsin-like serine protease
MLSSRGKGIGGLRERLRIFSVWAVLLTTVIFPHAVHADSGARGSIVGGETVAGGALPFLAFIIGGEGEEAGSCTGSLVSETLVLTAAHCLLNEEGTAYRAPESFGVYVGITNLSEADGHRSTVSRLVVDPSYRSSMGFPLWHDAGLIELSSPVPQPPVAFATSESWRAGTNAMQVGWGDTYWEQPDLTNELLEASTVVQGKRFCQQRFGTSFHPLSELCTLDYPSYASTTCQGDSGGPLLIVRNHEWIDIGITSFGATGCPTTKPIVYTRVDAVAPWIQAEIENHAPRLPQLTITEAKRDTFNVLRTDGRLRYRFSGHGGYRIRCSRSTRTAVACYPSWWKGSNDYWGKVVINLGWEGSEVVWFYRYVIRSVNDWCWWHSGHRGRCPIRSVRS